MKLLLIGFGGFIGAILRYGITQGANRLFPAFIPLGTLVVNVLGSYILAVVMMLAIEKLGINSLWRSFIAVGMMGALTTFSTFAFEVYLALETGKYIAAFSTIMLNMVLTLAAVWAGVQTIKIFY